MNIPWGCRNGRIVRIGDYSWRCVCSGVCRCVRVFVRGGKVRGGGNQANISYFPVTFFGRTYFFLFGTPCWGIIIPRHFKKISHHQQEPELISNYMILSLMKPLLCVIHLYLQYLPNFLWYSVWADNNSSSQGRGRIFAPLLPQAAMKWSTWPQQYSLYLPHSYQLISLNFPPFSSRR